MAVRKKPRRVEAQLAFESLSIEGGLLSPDWLARAAQLAAGQQSEADYRIPKGLNLRDEIGRYWRIAQAHWTEFSSGRSGAADPSALAKRFVLALLRDCFGFASLATVDSITISERVYPIGFSSVGHRVPVIIAPAAFGLDTPIAEFGDDDRRRSAFGLAQEYLNAADEAQWGIASDGVTMRIARDNASLTRPAWIEADLLRMFTEERYADFAALWLIAHETRFGRDDQAVGESALETWRKAGQEEGTRIRGKLEEAFEDAVRDLGQGFLAHPDNQTIRTSLQDGSLSTRDYFNQLLRLVYRLIFLLTVEERGLLHSDSTPDDARNVYAEGYGVKRLRERCLRRSAHDRFSDLWEAMKIVFRGLAVGESRLGLPALAGIFARAQCPALDGAQLENRALLVAMFRLAWLREPSGLSRVNWRDMGPEELGSVYEALLKLVPQVAKDGRQFTFASADEAKGHARKTTGSYYTPDSLVQVLLDNALEPVIAETIAKHPTDTITALLGLSIVDPACGSGHFLLGAARRLASHVARFRATGTPSAQEYRHALRQVVGRCIFGVDLNPMAVELCKVSLWMEAVEPGLPLTFLDSHIQQGNSLLGSSPALMGKGIPDDAWDPIEGDDNKTASALKKRNKIERTDTNHSFEFSGAAEGGTIAIVAQVQALDAASDQLLGEIEKKQLTWNALLASQQYRSRQLAADAWCAAFVWLKQPGSLANLAPTHKTWERLRDDPQSADSQLVAEVQTILHQYAFLHWHLAFPQVFAKGGFDVVLGNPPWYSLRLLEKEFFAGKRPEIAAAGTSVLRKARIAALEESDHALYVEYKRELRLVEAVNAFVVRSGAYPRCGVGRINLFALFAERNRSVLHPNGRAGFIVPTGIATDDTAKVFFECLMQEGSLAVMFSFWETRRFFPGTDSRSPFALVGLRPPLINGSARCAFDLRRVDEICDPDRTFDLTYSDVALVNPNTKTCPIFRSRRDAIITKAIYQRTPVLAHSGWRISLKFPLDIGRESGLFADKESDGFLPLYEGKYFHQFDHHWLSHDEDDDLPPTEDDRIDPAFRIRPRYWYPQGEVRKRLENSWNQSWTLVWRDIARPTDERTFIASVLPSIAVAHSAWLFCVGAEDLPKTPSLLANINSFVLDFVVRQKVGGTHLSTFIVEQLPLLPPQTYEVPTSWTRGSLGGWILGRVLELTYTSWDLEQFAKDMGYDGPPFRWDAGRRFLLRCELDAAFFHLYGLSRADTAYVMDTFTIVRKNDEKANDERYRTKETILQIYDAMSEAERIGKAYQTRLDPSPADPQVAHPSRRTKVVPLPRRAPAKRRVPAWDNSVITAVAKNTGVGAGAGAWSTSLSGEPLGTSVLAAVLRQQAEPRSREQVERAVVLALLPRLLQPQFDGPSAKRWKAVVGKSDLGVKSVTSLAIPWKEVIRAAIQQKVLVEDSIGRWSAGPDIDDVPTSALDARALVALSWIANAPAEDAAVTYELGVLRAA